MCSFFSKNGLILSRKWAYFGSKMGLFWHVLKKMQTLKPNPEIVELEIRSSNPLLMKHTRVREIQVDPNLTRNDLYETQEIVLTMRVTLRLN